MRSAIAQLGRAVLELEYTLIPHGLHVVGERPRRGARRHAARDRRGLARRAAERAPSRRWSRRSPERWHGGMPATSSARAVRELAATDRLLAEDHEIAGAPARARRPASSARRRAATCCARRRSCRPAATCTASIRSASRAPSRCRTARARPQRLLDAPRRRRPRRSRRSIALVLWGTDNLKTEGGPIAQALALIGAEPRFDSYGRLAGADLVPLAELGRPRIDVVVTLSGIFRDLLPLQTKLLAEAAFLRRQRRRAARGRTSSASTRWPTRRAWLRPRDGGAARLRQRRGRLRLQRQPAGRQRRWGDEDELAETYARRKSFAYGRSGRPAQQAALLQSVLAGVDLAYQNLESVELGVTTVDHYFDTLGGISRAVQRARGARRLPVYIGDQTRGEGKVRTLAEQVALETRTRMLNPKWYEGMLEARLRGRAPDRGARHQHHRLVGHHRPGRALGLPAADRDLRARRGDARAARARSTRPPRRKVANRLLEAHERGYWSARRAMLEALRERARSWRTGSKAST